MGTLDGKAALVTGGGRGIGAAIARRLAADGAAVAITYATDTGSAAAVTADTGGIALQADSADPGAVATAVDRTAAEFGRLDILVNNAGVFSYGPIEDARLAEIDRILAIHVRAVFVAAQAAIRYVGEDGRILSIGSSLAHRVPQPGYTLYAMSKSALAGFTRGLARDLGPRGITVNVVEPGSTDTDMNPANGPDADGERAYSALGRFARPDEIAAIVAHLAGPGGRFVTGASILVDGGYAA